jgi:AraC family transcriptional regulator, arabinose operon regulatory protein
MDIELLTASYAFHSQPYRSPRHLLPHYLLRLQTEGCCQAIVDGTLTTVKQGELLLYAPGQPYELRMEPEGGSPVRSGDYYIFCRGQWMDEWWKGLRKPSRLHLHLEDPNEPIVFLWKQLVLENRRRDGRPSKLGDSLLSSICLYIDRSIEERTAITKDVFIANRMKRYIETHATETFTSEDVARHVRLSVSRASHLFKEAFGEPFFQFALHLRLSIAVEKLLYSNMTLELIAESSGFSSYAFFHRKFKEKFGISPGEYRKKHPVY